MPKPRGKKCKKPIIKKIKKIIIPEPVIIVTEPNTDEEDYVFVVIP